ncbi:Alkaline phosphatase D [Wickerhamomyces ciferrii]|uniref:Alkaline phosphatase D n=1 Tax=Wickerhamomyces ciferrii (strain ATCC 14091 / BCRC 22168 / CBS 111 / JCM 3599 / NBRC 0793 / NRRL Y-1031 F-60-10) TaxID=1206466 RepID=K0KII8_WICCF|nr:Alkaline phosphatase D [Wickerhamomyces ciferrii]CCH40973.1 Alkaline phosphatase D [Wickerhamomyces ciferrii]
MLITSFLKSFLIYLWYLKKILYDKDSLINSPCSLENINFQLIDNQSEDPTALNVIPYQNFPLFIARPEYQFRHGVASGDSSSISTIFWTRITPRNKVAKASLIPVYFQLSTDQNFQNVHISGITYTNSLIDFTIKLHIRNLEPNQSYYYRFYDEKNNEIIGESKTLPNVIDNCSLIVTDSTKKLQTYNASFVLQLNDFKNKVFTRLRDYRSRYAFEQRIPNVTVLYGSNPAMYYEDLTLTNYHRALLEWFPIRPPKIRVIGKTFKFGDKFHISFINHQQKTLNFEKYDNNAREDDFTELSYDVECRNQIQIKSPLGITNINLRDYKGILMLEINEDGVTVDNSTYVC